MTTNSAENFEDIWLKQSIFASSVYQIDKPGFLSVANEVAREYIEKSQSQEELNPDYPAYMTENIVDSRMLPFGNYVAQTGWNILKDQGHEVDNLRAYFSAMWCQEHHKHSMMEQHVHADGSQIVGFYFLNAPQGSSRVLFHHPCPAKVQINLPEADINELSDASIVMNIVPTPGLLVFSNSWIPHSFTRNTSDEPLRFIHFNISVTKYTPRDDSAPDAEII